MVQLSQKVASVLFALAVYLISSLWYWSTNEPNKPFQLNATLTSLMSQREAQFFSFRQCSRALLQRTLKSECHIKLTPQVKCVHMVCFHLPTERRNSLFTAFILTFKVGKSTIYISVYISMLIVWIWPIYKQNHFHRTIQKSFTTDQQHWITNNQLVFSFI